MTRFDLGRPSTQVAKISPYPSSPNICSYSPNGDDIKEKLDRGEIDLGILLEPVEAAKYDYIRLPFHDTWGIVMRRADPASRRGVIGRGEVSSLPLILPRRAIVQEEIASWFGVERSKLNVFAVDNLLTNTILLAEGLRVSCLCTGRLYHPRSGKSLLCPPRARARHRARPCMEKEPYAYYQEWH